jgi:hypothetical protein
LFLLECERKIRDMSSLVHEPFNRAKSNILQMNGA